MMVEIESQREGRPGLVALEAADREPVMRLFGRLSPQSVYRRFFSPIARPDQFAAALLRVDQQEREAVAALENGEIVAVAQYARKPGNPHADLAIVVADAWQQQGLGTRLVAVLADRALRRGITAFAVDVQGDNSASIKLLRRVAPGLRLAFSGGVGEGSFPLGHDAR
jgi:RimJ/RimL family protein N-acetyltransferase